MCYVVFNVVCLMCSGVAFLFNEFFFFCLMSQNNNGAAVAQWVELVDQ